MYFNSNYLGLFVFSKKYGVFFKIILGKTAQNAVFLVNTSVLLFERNGWVLIEIGLEWSKIQANIMNFHLNPISESNLKLKFEKNCEIEKLFLEYFSKFVTIFPHF